MFTFIGCLGGLIGAAFISVNRMITQWRFKNINKKKKIYEALLIAVCMSLFQILVPLIWNRCTERPIDMQNWSDKEKELVDELVPLYCNPQTHYNELASLYLGESSIIHHVLYSCNRHVRF
jgi:H+/Cl- antiporter ClcA